MRVLGLGSLAHSEPSFNPYRPGPSTFPAYTHAELTYTLTPSRALSLASSIKKNTLEITELYYLESEVTKPCAFSEL